MSSFWLVDLQGKGIIDEPTVHKMTKDQILVLKSRLATNKTAYQHCVALHLIMWFN